MVAESAEIFRKLGIPVTAQRLAVWRAVSAQPHSTADAVADAVRSEIGAISRQSVYDALALLTGHGLIRRIQPAGSPARYESRIGDNHHHVICRLCGRTEDVDCSLGVAPCLTASDAKGYAVDEAEVIYWGRCPSCANATASISEPSSTQHAARSPQPAARSNQ